MKSLNGNMKKLFFKILIHGAIVGLILSASIFFTIQRQSLLNTQLQESRAETLRLRVELIEIKDNLHDSNSISDSLLNMIASNQVQSSNVVKTIQSPDTETIKKLYEIVKLIEHQTLLIKELKTSFEKDLKELKDQREFKIGVKPQTNKNE